MNRTWFLLVTGTRWRVCERGASDYYGKKQVPKPALQQSKNATGHTCRSRELRAMPATVLIAPAMIRHGCGMIPPITDALIANATQTQNMVAAGQAYWRQGRVSALGIDAEIGLITAGVRGGARRPYEVTIVFLDEGGGPISDQRRSAGEAEVECSCPVGYGCKHGAAVLFAARANVELQGASGSGSALNPVRATPIDAPRPAALPPALQQWLAEALVEVGAAQRATCDVLYVLTPHALHQAKGGKGKAAAKSGAAQAHECLPQRLTIAVWLWGQDGPRAWSHNYVHRERPSGPQWRQASIYELRDSQLPLGPLDQWLVRRMNGYSGDLDTSGAPKGVAGGDLIEKIVASGRARWRKVDGPVLRWADDARARWRWLTLAGGAQRPGLDGVMPGQILLATAPPIIVDESAGTLHRVNPGIDPALARRLLLMPPIPPDAVAQMAAQWAAVAGKEVPAPALAAIDELGQITPVAVLTFVQEKVDAWLRRRRDSYASYGGSTQKRDMALARLSFDYAGYLITPATQASEIIGNSDAGFIRFTRDIAAELRALEQMIVHGLTPLDGFEEIKAKPAQRWDFAPHAPALATDFARFMQTALPRLHAQGWRIEYGPKWRLTLVEVAAADMAFDVSPSGTDWFDITLGARIEGKVVDILPVLRHLLALGGQEFIEQLGDSITVPLGPGRLAQVPGEAIKPVLAMLLSMALAQSDGAGTLRLPTEDLAALVDLESASADRIAWRGGERLRQLARALTRIDSEPTAPPARFTATLRPYQQQGLDWLQALHRAGFGGVLADDMGLGKTVQALAHIATLKAAGKLPAPVLILCPTSVLPNWQAEIAQFTPDLTVLLWHGHDRQGHQGALATADIILTSYPLLLRDGALFARTDLALVLLDEAHVLKNPRTAGFRAARALRAPQVIALSGTPVENRLTDLWSLMELVTPGLLGGLDPFKRTLDKPITRDDDPSAKALLRRRLRPFMLRRTKDEVARDLPAKTEIPEWIELEKRQLTAYDSLRLLMQSRVRDEIARVGLMRSRIVFLDALLKLRQMCCDPRLVPGLADKNAGSGKLARLMEMLPALLAEGRRIIVFSQFTAMLDLIKPELDATDTAYVEICGQTKDRKTPVRQFQAGKVALILISLKAGGTGLNLTAADTVILYDPWWNPAVEAQAIDRAHRIGQIKPVFVHRLIAQGTIEEKILMLQDKKRALAAMLWEGDTGAPTLLTEDDIAFLLG